MGHREIQTPEFRDKQGGSCPRSRRDGRHRRIVIGILLRHNGEKPFTARDVNAPVLGIIEQIIGIAHTLHTGYLFSRLSVNNHEHRRCADANEQSMVGFVQCERKIGCSALEWPGGEHRAFVPINHCDVMRGRNIHEDAWPRLL